MKSINIIRLRQGLQRIDWNLLLFLLLVLNVKMIVKVAALLVLLFLNREMFRDKAIYRQKFIWFYAAMIVLAVINLGLNVFSISTNYFVAFFVGTLFWLLCIAAAFLSFWFVKTRDLAKLHSTVSLFFLLNIVVTIGQLLLIMLNAGAINPYTFQGMHQYYFMGTGDHLNGVTFDISTTNALLNGFGVFYFLQRGKTGMVWLCMMTLLLTTSNFSTLLVIAILVFLFLAKSTRNQKSVILVSLLLATVFMLKVSPQNDHYIMEAYKKMAAKKKPVGSVEVKNIVPLKERPDSILGTDERRQKIAMLFLDSLNDARRRNRALVGMEMVPLVKPTISGPDLHADINQRKLDTNLIQKNLLSFAIEMVPGFDTNPRNVKASKLPGKLIAFQQTFSYLAAHPSKIITGTGMGNFASKLAFRATTLQIAGGYPQKYKYLNDDFLNNHLTLYLTYFSKDKELHSLTNNPNAVYDQLLAEYGLAGLLAFMLLYLAFFVRRLKKLTYGVPLLLIILGAFFMDYWYEQLSIVIVFELLMLINMKESNPNA